MLCVYLNIQIISFDLFIKHLYLLLINCRFMDIVLLDMKVGIGLGGEVLLERAMSVCLCVCFM